MHTVPVALLNKFKKAHSVTSTPTITIEWNLNRFGTLKSIGNNGTDIETEEQDDEVFPIHSIIASRRPSRAAIVKGWTTPGVLGQEAPARKSSVIPEWRRTYTAAEDAKYKYWISPNLTTIRPSGGTYALTNCVPTITYVYGLNSNKLVAQFENTGSNPIDVVIQYTENGTDWINAGGPVTPNEQGRIELYLQDDGTWSATENLNNVLRIRGIRAKVTKMNKPRVHCHVIELAIMRKIDVSPRTVEYSFDYNNAEASFVAPLGQAETATGSLSLANFDGYLDNDRTYTDLYGMMNSPAKVEAVIKTIVDGESVTTPQGCMFVENWGEQTEDKRSITLEDGSMFLKQEYPPSLLIEKATGTEVIWRLLDSVGFADFRVDEPDTGDLKVPYYWTDPEKTVWDHIKELSETFQISCYFDELGLMRIKTREKVYEKDRTDVDWVLDGQEVTPEVALDDPRSIADSGKLPDIVNIEKPSELHANKVIVEYQKTRISSINKFQPEMIQVWEPEGTVALRSATLARTMSNTQGYGLFADSNFNTWPYEGYIQMNGEVMKWTKKRYKYLSKNGVWRTEYISSDAEKDVLDSKHLTRSHYNKFDGGLYFGPDGRGLMSTIARTHKREHDFNAIRTRHKNGTPLNKPWYTRADYSRSVFRIQTTKAFTGRSWTIARKGQLGNAPPRYIGTSFKFDKTTAYSQGSAGVFIGGQSYDSGYYIEVSITHWAGKRRSYTNEICVYRRSAVGTLKRIGKGVVSGIVKGKWYDLDVYQRDTGAGFQMAIMLNGVTVMEPRIPPNMVLQDRMSGNYGIFARGSTHVEFEYLYAANSIEDVPMDNSSRFDLIDGGFRSDYYNKYLYKARMNERLSWWSSRRRSMNTGFSFDEFGTEAHEIREFEVKFDPAPVLHSRLYLSNEWYSDCIEYVADHDSAKFFVIGKGRRNVILHGEDTLLYGKENPVDQKMFIYGREIKQEDSETYEVENKKSIRRVGEVELSISSPWIQSEPAAKRIGDWIADHWANGSEVLEVESFGNPFIQVGDIVGLCYLRKSMKLATHQYYVTGVTHSYSEGLTTSFRLQRKTGLIT